MEKFNFDKFKETATNLAQSGMAKSTQMTEMAKLQINIASEEDTIKKAYMEMGKYYYEHNQENPGPAYEHAFSLLEASKEKIATNNKRINELRNPDIMSASDIPTDTIPAEHAVVAEVTDFDE